MNRHILACGAVAGVLAFGNPGTAQAQSITLVNQQNNRCLDVPNGTSQNGALLLLWNCHGGRGQQFRMFVDSNMRDGSIRYEDRCVAAFDDGIRGARVGLWDCVDHPSQKWVLQPDGLLRGMNDFCVGIVDASSANGARLILWDCTVGAANQQWRAAPGSSTPFKITVTHPGRTVEATNGMALAIAWTFTGTPPADQMDVVLREKASWDWSSNQRIIPLGKANVTAGTATFPVSGLAPPFNVAAAWESCVLDFRIAGATVGQSETFQCSNQKR